ncbi:MAG TPA: hypothetical protein VJ396_04575, partial [Acidiferrobacterales bacterium]|nr:hypothetical protein [Acidiferrobacterales bacterium]
SARRAHPAPQEKSWIIMINRRKDAKAQRKTRENKHKVSLRLCVFAAKINKSEFPEGNFPA